MKKLIASALALLIMTVPVLAENEVNVYSNGNLVQDKGIIVDGRTLVPVRGVFEYMGYEVEWNAESKTATLTNSEKGNVVTLTNGETDFSVNGAKITPDVPQQIIDGRFMLPLRAVGEALSADVTWDSETKTANITEKDSEEITAEDSSNAEHKGDFSIPGVTITEIDPFQTDSQMTEVEF